MPSPGLRCRAGETGQLLRPVLAGGCARELFSSSLRRAAEAPAGALFSPSLGRAAEAPLGCFSVCSPSADPQTLRGKSSCKVRHGNLA